jgi:hypothetical protein
VVERHLAKVNVASSNLVFRSKWNILIGKPVGIVHEINFSINWEALKHNKIKDFEVLSLRV